MKYTEDRRFLYPVLLPENNDFPNGSFEVSIPDKELTDDTLAFTLEFQLLEPSIEQAIAEGNALLGAVLYCQPTMFRNLVAVPKGEHRLPVALPRSRIHGKLEVNPLCYATQAFDYRPCSAHAEYGSDFWHLPPGSVLAQEKTQLIGFPPPSFMKNYVAWKEDEELPDYEIRVDTDHARYLYIYSNKVTRSALHSLPYQRTKPSVYLAVLHEVFAFIQLEKNNGDLDESRKNRDWLNNFLEHLELNPPLGVDVEQLDGEGPVSPLQAAQRLFDHPFHLLTEGEA